MFGMMKYSRIVATFRRCDVERKSRRHGVAVRTNEQTLLCVCDTVGRFGSFCKKWPIPVPV
jgi:hypothetical protein